MLRKQIQQHYKTLKSRFLNKRIPPAKHHPLGIDNIFILPSFFGWGLIGIASCLFILGTNYQNNLILLFSFFLFSLILLSLFHAFFFFSSITIDAQQMPDFFAEQDIYLSLNILLQQKSPMGALLVLPEHGAKESLLVLNQLNARYNIDLGRYARGQYSCPRFKIMCHYPFGIFVCWSYMRPPLSFYVYPTAQRGALSLSYQASSEQSKGFDTNLVTSDDLQGIRSYRDTDPLHHVSWKHLAKGQGWLSKDFNEHTSRSGYLKLAQSEPIERALSQLCYQILHLSSQNARFGLLLPNQLIAPNCGDTHKQLCLQSLANFQGNTNENS